MKKLIFTLSFILFGASSLFAQSGIEILNSRHFVVEADNILFASGQTKFVTSNLNFVSLDGDQVNVQVAPNQFSSGQDGLGGITLEGGANEIRTKTDKKGNVTLYMSVSGVDISAQVNILVNVGSNKATATITPNFSGGNLVMTGTIYPYGDSNVIKGQTL